MDAETIPFNKPYVTGKELHYIAQSVTLGNIAADGHFTKACNKLICDTFDLRSSLMVTSCTSALEMAAILCNIELGDEVILPSYTFVSTANAFVRAGAKPIFADISPDTLNIDETKIAELITPRTKAIVPVHYAGISCEMDTIMDLAAQHDIRVVEDAAQAMHSYYKGRALGSIGDLSTFSYHETKNYVCGEGGTLGINDPELQTRAEIIRDKGTNRQQFFRGAVDKYTWVDTGSSYALSEISCAFLLAQLEALDDIREQRKKIYENYRSLLAPLETSGLIRLPIVPDDCDANYHMFYILLKDQETRDSLMQYLREHHIQTVFHYIPLHTSPMGRSFGYQKGQLPLTENLSGRLLRLPFYNEITFQQQERVADWIDSYLTQRTYRMFG